MKFFYVLLLILLSTGCSVRWSESERVYNVPEKEQPPLPPVVIIDAGHGGKDRGAHSDKNPRYEEKRLTLQTAKLVGHYLTKMGHPNTLTRYTDEFIGLKERAHLADYSGALVFVSVHYNSAPAKEAHGIEVFYYESKSDHARSKLSKELSQDVLSAMIHSTQAKSRGVKHGNLAVIRETHIPAILVEAGFLTHQGEREKIHTENYRHSIARGIAKGIDRYLRK